MMKYPITLVWSEEMERFCLEKKVWLAHPLRVAGVYKVGQAVQIQGPALVEAYSSVVPNNFFSIGAFSFSFSTFPAGTAVGRYCSIGGRVETMSWQHPTARFTTSPITYLPRWRQIARSDFGSDWQTLHWDELGPAPVIGNDVWIGDSALLKRGIRVGNGAVIAARSVVTEDVPDYAIVAGSPARIVRLRFEQRIVSRLMATEWWKFRYVDLPNERHDDVHYFIDALERQIDAAQIDVWAPGVFDLGEALARVAEGSER